MNHFKLVLVVSAIAFAISCGQSASTPNAKNSAANVTAVNSTTSVTGNAAPNLAARKNRQLTAAVDEAVEPSGDLYAQNCVICHKDTGKGGKVTIKGKNLDAADLTSEKMKKRSDEKLFEYISEGVPDEGMPAFKGKLNDDQIKLLVARVRELQSK